MRDPSRTRYAFRLAWAPRACWVVSALLAVSLAIAQSPTTVEVTGRGIGIGTMTGGTIQLGPTPDEVRALQKASAKDIEKLLPTIVKRGNDEIAAKMKDRGVSLGAAQTFLQVVKRKDVPAEEW